MQARLTKVALDKPAADFVTDVMIAAPWCGC